MFMRTLYIFMIGVLLTACSRSQQAESSLLPSEQEGGPQTAARCLEQAETALANDSIRLGETMLRKTISLAEAS